MTDYYPHTGQGLIVGHIQSHWALGIVVGPPETSLLYSPVVHHRDHRYIVRQRHIAVDLRRIVPLDRIVVVVGHTIDLGPDVVGDGDRDDGLPEDHLLVRRHKIAVDCTIDRMTDLGWIDRRRPEESL